MRLLVLCHAVPDLANLSISKSQDQVFEKGKRQLFAPSAVAVEAALQKKSAGDEVVALAWGAEANKEALRRPLAMGVDRAVWTAGDPAEAARGLAPDLVVAASASPLGADTLAWRVSGALDLARDRVVIVEAGALAPRIPNALAAMKAAKRPIEALEAPARERLVRRWATLLAGEES